MIKIVLPRWRFSGGSDLVVVVVKKVERSGVVVEGVGCCDGVDAGGVGLVAEV